jgi:Ca2+/H+ antiporter
MYGAIRSYRRYVFTIRSSYPSFVSCYALLIDSNSIEILVDVVDVVLNGSGIDEKFLGITLFALVPNTTEFMNAMSFAMNGNIALRYVLTVF